MCAVIISGPGVATPTIGALVLLAPIEVERAWGAVQLVHLLTPLWTRDLLTEE